MRKSKGYRSRTRKLLSKEIRQKGKLGLSKLLVSHNPGDKVCITINPSIHKGMPHKRYHGRVGTIAAKRGKSYVINVTLGHKMTQIISRPEHIHAMRR
jgi:large subunit ribosomal protein L21e